MLAYLELTVLCALFACVVAAVAALVGCSVRRWRTPDVPRLHDACRRIGVLRENMDVAGLLSLVRDVETGIEYLLIRQGKSESDEEVYSLRREAGTIYDVLTRIDNQNYASHMGKAFGHLDKIPIDAVDPAQRREMRFFRAHALYQKGENEQCYEALRESIEIIQALLGEAEDWKACQFVGCACIFHPSMFTGGKDIRVPRPPIEPAERAIIERGVELNNRATALYLRDGDWRCLPLVIAGKINAGWHLLHPEQNWTDLLAEHRESEEIVELYLDGRLPEAYERAKSYAQPTWLSCCVLSCLMIYNTEFVEALTREDSSTIVERGIDLAKEATKLYVYRYGWQTLPALLAVNLSAGWRKLHPDGK